MTHRPMPDHGAEGEISRLYPMGGYATPGLISNAGKVLGSGGAAIVGLGDMVVFYPWCLFEALDGDPTQIESVEVFPYYSVAAIRTQDVTLAAAGFFPRNFWCNQDIRPVAHPDATYGRTTRMNTQWQSVSLQDLRTDEHPLNPGGGSPAPSAVMKPAFWDIAVGDTLSIGLWFHSVGGVAPVMRAGEYFRIAVAFGGMARTY